MRGLEWCAAPPVAVTVNIAADTISGRTLAGQIMRIADVSAVTAATVGRGGELDRQSPLAGAGGMGEGGIVGMALGAADGAGRPQIVAMLLARPGNCRVIAVQGRGPVAGAAAGAGRIAAPVGGDRFKVAVDISAAV